MPFKPANIDRVNDLITADIKKELRLQGHHDTGYLEQSIRPYLAVINNEIILQAYAAEYISELEEGVPANKIKIDNAEFENLRGWVIRKIGVATPAEATAVAAAIVRKWKKEGKPLAGSKDFSESGEVLHAIKIAFTANENNYYNLLDDLVSTELDLEFDKTKSETI